MLWEKKTQLARETRATVNEDYGHGEIKTMKAEIHRMQVKNCLIFEGYIKSLKILIMNDHCNYIPWLMSQNTIKPHKLNGDLTELSNYSSQSVKQECSWTDK